MSLREPIPLMEVHSELSCLLLAVREAMGDLGVTVRVTYDEYCYLGVSIDLWPSPSAEEMRGKIIAVVARLRHGVLHDEYDYRFNMVAHPPLGDELISEWSNYEVTAWLNLSHWPHRRPHGWSPSRGPSSTPRATRTVGGQWRGAGPVARP